MERKQIILIAVSVAVVLGLAVFVWLWQKGKLGGGGPAAEEPEGFGSELFKKSSNPLGENKVVVPTLPEGINPLGTVKINPFKVINPFE